MAAKLGLEFTDANGKSCTIRYSHVDEDVSSSDVVALVNGIITNGSIFATVPVSAKDATIVVTTETKINLTNAA